MSTKRPNHKWVRAAEDIEALTLVVATTDNSEDGAITVTPVEPDSD